jgi:hypothetical protein
MFKIRFTHDIDNPDKEKRKKITGIDIRHGYYCLDSTWCDCRRKCKYAKGGFKFHNFSVEMHRFFEYRLHIKLPHLLYIGKKDTSLSGTTKCPFHKSRHYTCWDCIYSNGCIDGGCSNEQYHKATYEESRSTDKEWKHGKCKFFEATPWSDKWDRDTGEWIH